jgi:hypothetical protein
MEILPHFWIGYYHNFIHMIKEKRIKHILYLSKTEEFIKKKDMEQIRIPIDYDIDSSIEEKNNILYQHLFDITEYIHEKVNMNKNILLLGDQDRQDIDVIICCYFIRYGKISIEDSIQFLKSKKKNIFFPKCFFYSALSQFYERIKKNLNYDL